MTFEVVQRGSTDPDATWQKSYLVIFGITIRVTNKWADKMMASA